MERERRRAHSNPRLTRGNLESNVPSNGTRVQLRPSNCGLHQRKTEIQYFLVIVKFEGRKKIFSCLTVYLKIVPASVSDLAS